MTNYFKLFYETLKVAFDELIHMYIPSYFLYIKISSNGHLQNLLLSLFILNINAKPKKNYLLKVHQSLCNNKEIKNTSANEACKKKLAIYESLWAIYPETFTSWIEFVKNHLVK